MCICKAVYVNKVSAGVRGRFLSELAKVADFVSCSFVVHHVGGALVACSILVLSVAWVHAVLSFASAHVHHLMVGVLDVAKGSVDRGEGDSTHHKLVVDVLGVVVVATWCGWLSNLWLKFGTFCSLGVHGLNEVFLLLLLCINFVVGISVVHA